MQKGSEMHKPMLAVAASIAAALSFAAPARATHFPVSGTITVSGNAGSLPNGGTFGDSTYDPATGALSVGQFAFPQTSTVVNVPGFGNVTVTYTFNQTNTSTALVAGDGTAAMTQVLAQLSIVSTTLPLPVTPCRFGPIELDLAGSASSLGLDLEDRAFTVPPTTDSCGGFASQINPQLAGDDNSIAMHLAGDFTPPSGDDNDKIFIDGFDG